MFTRSRYFVLKRTQMHMVFSILAIVFVVSVITLSNLFYFFNYLQMYLTEFENECLPGIVDTAISAFSGRLAFLLLIDTVVLVILGIMVSHRIAGPVYKIQKVLSVYEQGDMSRPVRLRKTDLLSGLSESFNSCFDQIRHEFKLLKQLALNLPECREKHEIMERLDQYKLPDDSE